MTRKREIMACPSCGKRFPWVWDLDNHVRQGCRPDEDDAEEHAGSPEDDDFGPEAA